jgi:CheY-like chemotaxis protein
MAGPSILIIDDEAFMRRVVRQTLSSLGCDRVADVSSATEAVALLGKNRFDLILSDIYMPNMSGLELLKQIRTGKTLAPRDSRFIALTSFSNTEVLSTSILLDVNGFLVKPIKSELVKKSILKALHETMYLRPEEEYEPIKIETQWASREEKTVIAVGGGFHAPAPKAEPGTKPEKGSEALEPGVVLVSILQIPPDAVLAERLVAKDGTLLLSAGQKLNPQIINRLQELHSILRSDMLKIEVQEDKSEKV